MDPFKNRETWNIKVQCKYSLLISNFKNHETIAFANIEEKFFIKFKTDDQTKPNLT